MRHATLAAILLALGLATAASATTDSVLLLYTNDIHDHVRADYGGVGGMPYVSGFLTKLRAQRADTLTLDAGDVTEKGDMVALASRGEMTYEAMRHAGYQVGVAGNHDYEYGLEQMKKNEQVGGFPLLGVGVLDKETGRPLFEPSRVFDVDGVRVGVIGVSNVLGRDALAQFLKGAELEAAILAEVGKLREQTELLVVLAHQGSKMCLDWAPRMPDIDVFVSAHTHEKIDRPMVVAETGALVVQAHMYAHYVGQLDLVVDLAGKRVVSHAGGLTTMTHSAIAPDEALQARTREREKELCPQAAEVICRLDAPLGGPALARLFAEALKARAGADVALCSVELLRDSLPAGDVDLNAANRTFVPQPARRSTATVKVSGAALVHWIEKGKSKQGLEWTGFEAQVAKEGEQKKVTRTDLDPARLYTVALAGADAQALAGQKEFPVAPRDLTAGDYTVIDALVAHLKSRGADPKTPPAGR